MDNIKERREQVLLDLKKEEERKIEIERYINKLKEEFQQINGKNN